MLVSVLSKKEYLDANGQLQTRWYRAGYVKETDSGARYLTLFQQPGTTFLVVPSEDAPDVIHIDD